MTDACLKVLHYPPIIGVSTKDAILVEQLLADEIERKKLQK